MRDGEERGAGNGQSAGRKARETAFEVKVDGGGAKHARQRERKERHAALDRQLLRLRLVRLGVLLVQVRRLEQALFALNNSFLTVSTVAKTDFRASLFALHCEHNFFKKKK